MILNKRLIPGSRIFFAGQDGTWTQVSSQGVVTTAGDVYVTLTDTSTPSIKDLTGMAFALVNPINPTGGAIPITSAP